jgi:acyl-CoA thioester hydrolase
MNERILPGAGDLDLQDPDIYARWNHEILRFADTDAVGHVNNGAFAACFESSRIKTLKEVGPHADEGAIQWVLARLSIDFNAQLFYPGEVDVGTRVVHTGRASLRMVQGLFAEGTCRGTAVATMVLIDLPTGHSTPIPDFLRTRIDGLTT